MSANDESRVLNTGRQFEIDLIKAVSIIIIVVCHVFANLTTVKSELGLLKPAVFFLGNTSAGLFIFCMGIGIVYTAHGSPASFVKRGIKLFLQGHLLTFCTNAVMLLVYRRFGLEEFIGEADRYAFFSTDILAFAGLAFLMTALLTKLKCKPWFFCVIAVVFQVIATVFSGAFDDSPLAVRYLIGPFFYPGSSDISMYPLFPFFIYVAFGMLYGELLKRTMSKRRFYLRSAIVGGTVCLIASVIYKTVGFDIVESSFYDNYHEGVFPAAIWYISQAAVWIVIAYPASLIVKGKAQNAVKYLSRNITNIYVLQWPWLLLSIYVILINKRISVSAGAGVPLSVGVCLATVALSLCWTVVKKKLKKNER